jgi:hypothetical protein
MSITYIDTNVIKGDFTMNNPQPVIGLCHKEYDITDLLDTSDHLEINLLSEHEMLPLKEQVNYWEFKR